MASGSAGGSSRGGGRSGGGSRSTSGKITSAKGRQSKYANATSKYFGGYGGIDSVTVSNKRGGTRKGQSSWFLPF